MMRLHLPAMIACMLLVIAGSTSSLASQEEATPDYVRAFGDLFSSVGATGDFAIVRRNSSVIRSYFSDVISTVLADSGDGELIEDLCRYYLFLHSHEQMGPREWDLVRRLYESEGSLAERFPLLCLNRISPSYDAAAERETERQYRKARIEALVNARWPPEKRLEPAILEGARKEVDKCHFVASKTVEYLRANTEKERRELAEEMYIVIHSLGYTRPKRCGFGVLEWWPYVPALRELADRWLVMTADTGRLSAVRIDLPAQILLWRIGLGMPFEELLSVQPGLPPAYGRRMLMMTALASGEKRNLDRAIREIEATPELGPSDREWLNYFAGSRIDETAADWGAFACFAPFMNQSQCDDVATSILSRLRRPDAGLVELDEGIRCYCALKHKRPVDEHEIIEIARLRLPCLWTSHLVRYNLGRRLSVNVVGLMPEYAVVDFRDEDAGGPFAVYGISKMREAKRLNNPSEFDAFDRMLSDVFMMLRVLFLLLIKAEEG
jgi:hypothetical protein